MVELITTDLVEDIVEMRHCPKCNMRTTLLHFTTTRKDKNDIKEDDYHRCLKCLTLFQLELREVKDDN